MAQRDGPIVGAIINRPAVICYDFAENPCEYEDFYCRADIIRPYIRYRNELRNYNLSLLTFPSPLLIIIPDRRTNKSSGCRTDPAEIGLVSALTREPDTANTVGGKDA